MTIMRHPAFQPSCAFKLKQFAQTTIIKLLKQAKQEIGMEYMSTTEASEKWSVSLRQIQRLLADRRIPGAEKCGQIWLIPENAKKPPDLRTKKKPAYQSLLSDLDQIIRKTTIPMPIHNPDKILETVNDQRLQIQYEGELSYLRGDFEKTLCCYESTEGDDASRLRASSVAIAASISLGEYHTYAKIEAYLKEWAKTGKGSHIAAISELALSTAAVSVIAPNMASEWLKQGFFDDLPTEAKPDALYLRAKYFQCLENYEAMLAVAQTALAFCQSNQGITTPEIYLYLSCAIASHSLGRDDVAKNWLLKLMHICLPCGFITPFAESLTALGSLVEQCLEQTFPTYHDVVIHQWKRTWKNWITFHNQFTKDNITLVLTLREYQIALMVAHHIPYTQIADQYHISVGRLKNIMMGVYDKLLISGRNELSKYVF